MVTLKELKAQKARLIAQRNRAINKQRVEFEKVGLEKEIKVLQRKPSTSRNIKLAQRTGRGLKILSRKFGSAALRQAKRIKEQQLRDDAIARARAKKGKTTTLRTTEFVPVKRKGKKTLFKKRNVVS